MLKHSLGIGRAGSRLIGAVLPCVAVGAVGAATIFTEVTITGDSDILNTGVLVEANDLGASPSAVTVNSVTFGTDSSGLSGLNTIGGPVDFSLDPFSPELDALLSDLLFDSGFTQPATLTVSGLTFASPYRLQLLFSNDFNITGNNIDVTVQGSSYNLSGWQPAAINLVIDFVADGPSVVVDFSAGAGSAGTASGLAVLNAYAVHLIPAPGTLALLGLAGLMGARRRRR